MERSDGLNKELNPSTSVSITAENTHIICNQIIRSWQNIMLNLFIRFILFQLVGVRIPDYAFIRQLAQICSEPLALTSANISTQESTLTVEVLTLKLSCDFRCVPNNKVTLKIKSHLVKKQCILVPLPATLNPTFGVFAWFPIALIGTVYQPLSLCANH